LALWHWKVGEIAQLLEDIKNIAKIDGGANQK